VHQKPDEPEPLLTPERVGRWLGESPETLAQMRYLRTGPDWIKVGAKSVRYEREAVERWLREKTQASR
jgi:predicted DNA-binding transcriptional regulator AlpA